VSGDRRQLEDGCVHEADKDRARMRACLWADMAEVLRIASE